MGDISGNHTKKHMPWDQRATINPLYTVMSADEFIDKNEDPATWTKKDLKFFFEKGQRIYDFLIKPNILRMNLDKNKKTHLIVDYGCGMGRILRAVKQEGFPCAGIDVSPAILKCCRKINPNIRKLFLLDKSNRCKVKSESADFVYSFAVLQHIPKLSTLKTAFTEMFRILKPGGILKVQIFSKDIPSIITKKSVYLNFLFNFEDKSLLLSCNKYFGKNKFLRFIGFIPEIKIIYHNYWVGVPIAFGNLYNWMRRHEMTMMGIEKDIGKDNMYWITAMKKPY